MDFSILVPVVAAVVLAAACLWQWRRYRKTVKKVAFLFNALDNGDYTFHFPEGGRLEDDHLLNASLNRVKDILRHARDEQKEREKYFELIIDSVDTGILVLDDSRGIVLRCNKAALRLLGRDAVTHISQVEDRLGSLSVREAYTTLKGRRVKILAMSDIKGELANQEIDSWVKLIRVLTHEIMNSVAPIVSLSKTFLERDDVKRSGIYEGMQAIHETSAGLISFVNNYRVASTLQNPAPEPFYLADILRQVEGLGIVPANVDFSYNICPKDLIIYADPNLIRQVLINIVKNAVQAIGKADGRIHVKAVVSPDDRVMVYVCNDGPVIPRNVAEEIFTPFFTTKTDGNGIGLSLSRQIMKLSGGSIDLLDTGSDGWPVTFQLRFD